MGTEGLALGGSGKGDASSFHLWGGLVCTVNNPGCCMVLEQEGVTHAGRAVQEGSGLDHSGRPKWAVEDLGLECSGSHVI